MASGCRLRQRKRWRRLFQLTLLKGLPATTTVGRLRRRKPRRGSWTRSWNGSPEGRLKSFQNPSHKFCLGSSERVHISLRQKQRVEQKHLGIMDIYEVELCRRGRWEQQDARFVAATDADEAAYKVTREHLHSEGERRKVRLRVRRLGNGSPPPKLFYAA